MTPADQDVVNNILRKPLLDLAQHGMDRCALGWGKYPLGVRHAVNVLRVLLTGADRQQVDEALTRFDARLDQ